MGGLELRFIDWSLASYVSCLHEFHNKVTASKGQAGEACALRAGQGRKVRVERDSSQELPGTLRLVSNG